MEKIIIYTDGASRGNPGHSSYGFVVINSKGDETYQEGKYLGLATNNIAEYTAVIEALNYIKDNLGVNTEIEIRADSNLVVQQLSGKFKIKTAHIKVLIDRVKSLEKQFIKVVYRHIPRWQNKIADSLANKALDNL